MLLLAALYGIVGLAHSSSMSGSAGAGFWLLVVALGFAVWHVMQRFTTSEPKGSLSLALYRVIVPGIFGIWFLAQHIILALPIQRIWTFLLVDLIYNMQELILVFSPFYR